MFIMALKIAPSVKTGAIANMLHIGYKIHLLSFGEACHIHLLDSVVRYFPLKYI